MRFSIKIFFKKLLPLWVGLFLFSGCSLTPLYHPSSVELTQKAKKLSTMIEALNSSINRDEAREFSKSILLKALALSKSYQLVSPPLWHNTLVNIGIRKRGLCYEWTEDLLSYLHQKRYQSLKFHYVGANINGYFEHNALAVSARKEGLEKSILLDAWRGSGNLYFIPLKEDTKYQWSSREDIYELMFPHLKRWRED